MITFPRLGVQQGRDLLDEILNNGIRAPVDLQSRRDSVCLDIRDDGPRQGLDLLRLLRCPHRRAELPSD